MARARLVTTDPIAAEVERLHRLLAEWLGTECAPAVLAALRAAHAEEFSIITVDGAVLPRAALFDALSGARNAAPGLEIDVDEIEVVAAAGDSVVVRFRETHRHGDGTTRRRTTAVLRRGSGGYLWQHVHETAVA
ncbi:DUF4440 domain-containing protein [Saccharopolyspora taberi]|uniref:DUF4440 domain-containing protein n=1 Tax=Saccharopolyspora taberi TaxID=60895 RepID=A0ABN3VGJ7_9PSEU